MDQYVKHLQSLLNAHRDLLQQAHQQGKQEKVTFFQGVVQGIELALETHSEYKAIEKNTQALNDEGGAHRLLPAGCPDKVQ